MLPLLLMFAACQIENQPQGKDTESPVPDEIEYCDGIDNDGDGGVDETYDLDADGFVADTAECRAAALPLDCNDGDPLIHPGADERCDGVDNDCSGTVDDAPDEDADGWTTCEECDDTDPMVNPTAADVCDGIDNDCSGLVDEEWDEDGDGVSPCAGDCNDRDPQQSPMNAEMCDGYDNDCDGYPDEDFDIDRDGWSTCEGDCDDSNASTWPAAPEACDDQDNDCDGLVEDNDDQDNDGFTVCDGDCLEGERTVSPLGTESCDELDNDCNGVVDDDPECYGCEVYGSYLYCSIGATWTSAESTCQYFGYSLAIIHDEGENSALGSAAMDMNNQGTAWIGLSDEALEGTYVWMDGSAMDYSHWLSGQPDANNVQNCVATSYQRNTGEWGDVPCGNSYPYICER